ncbi:MAG: response regulator [Propionibacteriaceae bacterium]|nr:response regulator [Propionibacteriaceae bacterium]
MNDEQFLTTEEVLEYLQVNLRTVYRLIKAGKLPAVRVGRQWRFRRRDVEHWLARNRTASKAPGVVDAGERSRILVADDEQAVRDLLVKTLSGGGYQVDTAVDGLSAIERLRATDYDLLITDLKMPGMDGLSVIREARRRSLDLPIIIITGYSTEASAIEALNMGVCGYLTKPFRLQRVLAVAARALGDDPPPLDTRDTIENSGFRPE